MMNYLLNKDIDVRSLPPPQARHLFDCLKLTKILFLQQYTSEFINPETGGKSIQRSPIFPPVKFNCQFTLKPDFTPNNLNKRKFSQMLDGVLEIDPLKVRIVETDESWKYRKDNSISSSSNNKNSSKFKNKNNNNTRFRTMFGEMASEHRGQMKNDNNHTNKIVITSYANVAGRAPNFENSSQCSQREIERYFSQEINNSNNDNMILPFDVRELVILNNERKSNMFQIHSAFWWVLRNFYPEILTSSKILPFANFWKCQTRDPEYVFIAQSLGRRVNNTTSSNNNTNNHHHHDQQRREREDDDDDHENNNNDNNNIINSILENPTTTQWNEEFSAHSCCDHNANNNSSTASSSSSSRRQFRLVIKNHYVEFFFEDEEPTDMCWHYIFAQYFNCDEFVNMKGSLCELKKMNDAETKRRNQENEERIRQQKQKEKREQEEKEEAERRKRNEYVNNNYYFPQQQQKYQNPYQPRQYHQNGYQQQLLNKQQQEPMMMNNTQNIHGHENNNNRVQNAKSLMEQFRYQKPNKAPVALLNNNNNQNQNQNQNQNHHEKVDEKNHQKQNDPIDDKNEIDKTTTMMITNTKQQVTMMNTTSTDNQNQNDDSISTSSTSCSSSTTASNSNGSTKPKFIPGSLSARLAARVAVKKK